jgi:hypothetical protein
MTTFRLPTLLVAAAYLAAAPPPARSWTVREGGGNPAVFGEATGVATDAAGDVLVSGVVTDDSDSHFGVAKLDGASGVERWRYLTGVPRGSVSPEDVAEAVAVDASGDVIAAGYIGQGTPGFAGLVVKLSGATGAELWRHEVPGVVFWSLALAGGDVAVSGNAIVEALDAADGTSRWRYDDLTAYAVAVGPSGDLFASGHSLCCDPITHVDFTVVRLAQATGTELWRHQVDGSGHYFDNATSLAIDGNGDVLAGGELQSTPGAGAPTFMKLAGADGSEQWRQQVSGGGVPGGIALDAAGDVLVTGGFGARFAVLKLAAGDGAQVWRRDVSSAGDVVNGGNRLVLDADGNVLAAGFRQATPGGGSDFAVAKVAGADGAELWVKSIAGGMNSFGFAGPIALDPTGGVAATGVSPAPGGDGATVVKLDEALGGTRLKVKDSASNPSRRLLQLAVRDPRLFSPAPIGPGDPTVAGGSLTLHNPDTGETTTLPLPASMWKGLGTPAGAAGWAYADRDRVAGPCRKVEIRDGALLRASCTGAGIGFTLDETPGQGRLAVELATGHARACLLFGGTVTRDRAAGTQSGLFDARDAPAPSACAGP